jgi:hypothetical protein
MIIQEIVDYFFDHKDHRGIPNISNTDWKWLSQKYDKDDIRQSLAEYIISNNIPFPLKEISEERFKKLFIRFCKKSFLEDYKDFDDVLERYDYRYKYQDNPLKVIDKSHFYNDVSDYFQQENRMKCGSNSVASPIEIWNSREKLNTMNWHFWRSGVMSDNGLTDKTFRSGFRLGTYNATQFRPSVAKALYEKHNAVNVLDTSCGWGDRLAGFYATRSTKLYVGCDPNPDVYEVYKQQCVQYEKLLGTKSPNLIEKENYFECVGVKTTKIWNLPSEDVNWSLYNDTFDLYFTSPPYFDTEKYASDTNKIENQSWSRYSSFESWKNNFFFPVSEMVWPTIKQGGFMMINIIEPRVKSGKRMNLCDDMVDHFITFDDCHYIGKIGMRMMARPNAEELTGVFIEPIWTFRKGVGGYIDETENTLEDFFV